MCEEKLYPVWFSRKRKSYSVQRKYNLSLIIIMRIKSDRPWQDLRECADLIASSVCCIFNRSITTSIFPEEWKCSKVISLLKQGRNAPTLKNNYRPISIIPVVGKVFERVVYDQFYMYLTFSPAKWRLGNERRNSILMTRHYSDLGTASDWTKQISSAVRPIRTITQIWVVTRHQYGISALVSQTSFRGETSGGVAKCRLFSQSILLFVTRNLYQFQCFFTYRTNFYSLFVNIIKTGI